MPIQDKQLLYCLFKGTGTFPEEGGFGRRKTNVIKIETTAGIRSETSPSDWKLILLNKTVQQDNRGLKADDRSNEKTQHAAVRKGANN